MRSDYYFGQLPFFVLNDGAQFTLKKDMEGGTPPTLQEYKYCPANKKKTKSNAI